MAKAKTKYKRKRVKRSKHANLTPKESLLVRAFMEGKSKRDAAIIAGYSPKNPSQSATQSLDNIRRKAPELLDEHNLSLAHLIKHHLAPLLHATEVKFFQKDGKVVQLIEVADTTTRRFATRMAFELHGSFVAQDPRAEDAAHIRVVVLDVPRPDRRPIDVTPQKQLPEKAKTAPDPRPKD